MTSSRTSRKRSPGGDSRKPDSRGRKILRVCRVLVLLGVFLSISVLFHLNKAGLPEVVKKRILASLQEKGFDAEFSRVRLRWYRGIVVEDLQVQSTNRVGGLHLFVSEAQCHLDHQALWRLRPRVSGLYLEEARMIWPQLGTNGPAQSLRLESLRGDLVFKANAEWELKRLTASCLNTRFEFSGSLTNAEAIRTWDFSRREPDQATRFQDRWRRWMSLAQKVEFSGIPEVRCQFFGDARDLETFQGTVHIDAPAMKSPWGAGTNIAIQAQWYPADANLDPVQAELMLSAAKARTPWGQAAELKFYAHGLPSFTGWVPTNINMAVEVRDARTAWGRATFAVLTANSQMNSTNIQERFTQVTGLMENLQTPWGSGLQLQVTAAAFHPRTNFMPATVSGEVQAREVTTPWGQAGLATMEGSGVLPHNHHLGNTNLLWPDRLADTVFGLSGALTNVTSRQVTARHLVLDTEWAGPRLGLRARGQLADGEIEASAELDVDTREVIFQGFTSMDPHGIRSLLTTNAQQWLSRYSWVDPPRAGASGRLVLPPWNQRQPDWKGTVQPTIEMAGNFEVGPAAYRGAEFLSARSPFTLTNLVWKMTGLHVTRPEGELRGEYESHLIDRNFHWSIDGSLDPHAFAPLLDGPRQKRAFDLIRFSGPPHIAGEIFGNWRDLTAVSFAGHALATNFVFRGEPLEYVEADVELRDKRLSVYQPKGTRVANETAAASGLMIDLTEQKLYLTNLFARVSARPATKIISDQAYETMLPYEFEAPPVLHVDGIVDIKKGRQEYDLQFEITGGAFRWQKFRFDGVSGNLHWLNQTLLMTNLAGAFHQGRARGHAFFDFSIPHGAKFHFFTQVTNVDFHSFMGDISTPTNNLEGILSGRLRVTEGRTDDWQSWQGRGAVYLEDGLIWDIPVFGVFSPIFNTIAPGLGNSRARSATATYRITNSVIHTDNLAVNATGMRMQFSGTSDFDRRIDGRMEAELLRNMPAVGVVISKVLWPVTKLFEYKITGTLQDPVTEPVYIFPKIIFLPLSPIKSLKEIFVDPFGVSTNQSVDLPPE